MDFDSYRDKIAKKLDRAGIAWTDSMEQTVYMTFTKGRCADAVADALIKQAQGK